MKCGLVSIKGDNMKKILIDDIKRADEMAASQAAMAPAMNPAGQEGAGPVEEGGAQPGQPGQPPQLKVA
jgi:hypothetical protein